ncbi:unnamed protein product, partial [Effrenium voratum]
EALAATFTCQGCRALQQQKLNDSWQAMHAVQHSFHEPGDCHGLGVVVHGLANAQQMLTEAWYRKALETSSAALYVMRAKKSQTRSQTACSASQSSLRAWLWRWDTSPSIGAWVAF